MTQITWLVFVLIAIWIINGVFCFWAMKKIRKSDEVKAIGNPAGGYDLFSDNKKLDFIIVLSEVSFLLEISFTGCLIMLMLL